MKDLERQLVFTPYDLYQKKGPPKDWVGHLADCAWESRDRLCSDSPSTLREVAMLPTRWDRQVRSYQLVVTGTFRSRGKMILDLSELLVEPYLKSGILPYIRPVPSKDFSQLSRGVLRNLERRGLLLFSSYEEEDLRK